MAHAVAAEITGMGPNARPDTARWLIEHLLQAEHEDYAMRSVRYQLTATGLPVQREWPVSTSTPAASIASSSGNWPRWAFTEDAHNAVFAGGTGTGKIHLAKRSPWRASPSTASGHSSETAKTRVKAGE